MVERFRRYWAYTIQTDRRAKWFQYNPTPLTPVFIRGGGGGIKIVCHTMHSDKLVPFHSRSRPLTIPGYNFSEIDPSCPKINKSVTEPRRWEGWPGKCATDGQFSSPPQIPASHTITTTLSLTIQEVMCWVRASVTPDVTSVQRWTWGPLKGWRPEISRGRKRRFQTKRIASRWKHGMKFPQSLFFFFSLLLFSTLLPPLCLPVNDYSSKEKALDDISFERSRKAIVIQINVGMVF